MLWIIAEIRYLIINQTEDQTKCLMIYKPQKGKEQKFNLSLFVHIWLVSFSGTTVMLTLFYYQWLEKNHIKIEQLSSMTSESMLKKRKTLKLSHNENIYETLYLWFSQELQKDMMVSGPSAYSKKGTSTKHYNRWRPRSLN